jgi:hypothetical protein
MSHGGGKSYKGKSEGDNASLQDAIVNAWENAAKDNAPAGTYAVSDIEITTVNPIHGYSVTITPTG